MTFTTGEARDAQDIIPGPTPPNCIPAQPPPCRLPLLQSLANGLGGHVCVWDPGAMMFPTQLPAFPLPCPTDLKETGSVATWLKLFSNTTIICGRFVASWGRMFWSGSATPLPQELLVELTANRFSLLRCGLMSNSAQWELTSWQTRSVSGGWGGGEENVSYACIQGTASSFTDGPAMLL